jgi:hypothetical protein
MTKKQSDLQKKNPTLGTIEMARKNEETVLGFYDATGLGGAIGKSQFDLQEEVDTIISHIRDTDPKVSLAALKHFRSVLKDIMGTTGQIASINRTHLSSQPMSGGDITTRTSLTASALMTNLRKENEFSENRDKNKDRYEVHPALGDHIEEEGSSS